MFIYPKLIEGIHQNIEKKLNIIFEEKEYDYMYLVYICTSNCLFSDKWTKEDLDLIEEIVLADKGIQSLIDCFEEKCNKTLRNSYVFNQNGTFVSIEDVYLIYNVLFQINNIILIL